VRNPLVDAHIAALVDLDARALGEQPVRERAAPDRHQDRLDLELLPVAEHDRGVVAGGLVTGDGDAGAHVIPRLVKERTITLATSVSQPGRILGSASSKLTRTPRSDSMEANSQPIAPAPITAADFGSWRSASSSSEVMT